MSNHIYQVWDKIEHEMVGTFDSHNEARKEIEKHIQSLDDFWEEYDYEIRKVNVNKED